MYSHDGIRDALTQLAAPPLLYEELRREIARAKRANERVGLVRLVLASKNSKLEAREDSSASSFQEIIVNFAHCLARLSRDEDICARMGEREFLCLLHGKEESLKTYVARIVADWSDSNNHLTRHADSAAWKLDVASLVSYPGENALELLNRLDQEILISYE